MKGLQYVMDLNGRRSMQFVRGKPERDEYRRKRQVEVGWIGCMDPRPLPHRITGMPLGIWPVWQNIGGKFDLEEWPRFQESIFGLVECAKRNKRKLLWLLVAHGSGSDDARLGCRGHNYCVRQAQAANRKLKRQFDEFFRGDPDVYTVTATVDTDGDTLTFHGDCHPVDTVILNAAPQSVIEAEIEGAFLLAPKWVWECLTEIAMLNQRHSNTVRQANRPILATQHHEFVIAVGRGTDHWLHDDLSGGNIALTITPFDPALSRVVRSAAAIIASNISRGSFKLDQGVAVISTATFRSEYGQAGMNFAATKARSLAKSVIDAVCSVNELRPYRDLVQFGTLIVNNDTLKADLIEEEQ